MQNHAPLCVIAGGERILGISGLLAGEISKASLAHRRTALSSTSLPMISRNRTSDQSVTLIKHLSSHQNSAWLIVCVERGPAK